MHILYVILPLNENTSDSKKFSFYSWNIDCISKVFKISLLNKWIYTIDMATWFLILTLEITTTIFEFVEAWRMSLSSLQIYIALLSLLLWLDKWKENQLGKISINLEPEENLSLN